jgi:iron complex outermembrane receptor protein
MKLNAIYVALAAIAAGQTAQAQTDHGTHQHPAGPIEHVLVTVPLHKEITDTPFPVNVMTGDELSREVRSTLGETIENQPGMFNASYGPGVGQPVIRGLAGPRVMVLQNGTTSADVSTYSQDHAVAVEPLLANTVEILRGPSTLYYGGGAIGGVVNVIDNRIPVKHVDETRARVGYRYDGASSGNVAAGMVETSLGDLSLHFDGVIRETDDLDVADGAGTEEGDVLLNTDTEADSFTLGGAWHFDKGFFGLSVSQMNSNYGLPAGTHDHSHDDEHEEELEEAHDDHDHMEDEEGGIRLDLEQTRYDALVHLHDPLPGIEVARGFLTVTEYAHKELEPGGGIGVEFDSDTTEARVELVHNPVGNFDGAVGLQYINNEFSAVGEEAYVVPTDVELLGIFFNEDWHRDALTIEFGARLDSDELTPLNNAGPGRSFDSLSASAGLSYALFDGLQLNTSVSRAERAPTVSELYANVTNLESEEYVEHVAIGAIPLGDVDLDTEQSLNFEAGFTWVGGGHQVSLTGFVYDFDSFIYARNTGLFGEAHGHDDHDHEEEDHDHEEEHDDHDMDHDEDHDHEEDYDEEGAPILQWDQEAALFVGIELDANWLLSDGEGGRLMLETGFDYVRADLDRGGDVPRMPPLRGRLGLNWADEHGYYFARVVATDRQDRAGRFEEETDGWVRVDLGAEWNIPLKSGELSVNAGVRNLTNEEIRLSTSFLREYAPEPGRSLQFGVRWDL